MLARFAETREYHQMLVKQLREAREFAGGEEIILYIDPSDAQYQYSIEAEVGAPVTVSTYSFLGGTRAVLPGRNILIDNSFETKQMCIRDSPKPSEEDHRPLQVRLTAALEDSGPFRLEEKTGYILSLIHILQEDLL